MYTCTRCFDEIVGKPVEKDEMLYHDRCVPWPFEEAKPVVKNGTRIRLIECKDPFTHLEPGLEGIVVCTDALGTVFVDWDSGQSLGLVPDHDSFEVVR